MTPTSLPRARARPISAALSAVAILAVGGCEGRGPLDEAPGEEVLLRWGGDVIAAGDAVTLRDSVGGDVMMAGGDLRFGGTTEGSYLGAGSSQDVGGRIGGSARAAGGVVRLHAAVARNVTLAGGEVIVDGDAVVGRNAYAAAGRVEVVGSVEGSLRVAGGEVILDGPVLGDVHVDAGTLRVGPDARIEGDLRYRVRDAPASIDPGARIAGAVVERPSEPGEGGRTVQRVLRVLAFLLAGGVLVGLFPGAATAAAVAARNRSAASAGVGLLCAIGVPIGIGVTALSIVGIPLAIIVALLFGIALYLAPVPPAVWLGSLLLEARTPPGRRSGRVAEFAAGGAVLGVLSFVPIVGLLVRAAVVLVGLGAAALAVRKAREGRRAAA